MVNSRSHVPCFKKLLNVFLIIKNTFNKLNIEGFDFENGFRCIMMLKKFEKLK